MDGFEQAVFIYKFNNGQSGHPFYFTVQGGMTHPHLFRKSHYLKTGIIQVIINNLPTLQQELLFFFGIFLFRFRQWVHHLCRFYTRQQLIDPFTEIFQWNRFDQISLLRGFGSQHNDRNMGQFFISFHQLQEIRPIHFRHHHIADYDIG